MGGATTMGEGLLQQGRSYDYGRGYYGERL